MTEHLHRDPFLEVHSVPPEQLRRETADCLLELKHLGETPAGDSDVVRAFVTASLADLGISQIEDSESWQHEAAADLWSDEATTNLNRHMPLVELFRTLIVHRPEMDAGYKAQFWRIVWQSVFTEVDKRNYPRAYTAQSVWQTAFRAKLKSSSDYHEIEDKILTKHNQANEPRRYAPYKLALAMHSQFFPETGASLLDIGTSAGLGLVQILDNKPFRNIEFLSDDEQVNDYMRKKVIGRTCISLAVGCDIDVVMDQASFDWVDACTSRADELLDRKKRQFRRELKRARERLLDADQGLKLVRGNLIPYHSGEYDLVNGPVDLMEEVQSLAPNSNGTYDAASAVFTAYEWPEDERSAAIDRMTEQADVLSFMVDWFTPPQLDISPQPVFAGPYNAPVEAYINYSSDPERRWRLWGTYTGGGRAKSFKPSPALVSLIRDRIKHPTRLSRLEETD